MNDVGAVIGLVVAAVLAPWLRGEIVSVPLGPWRGALLGAATGAVWCQLALRGEPRALDRRKSRVDEG
jgi:hypothetical protein